MKLLLLQDHFGSDIHARAGDIVDLADETAAAHVANGTAMEIPAEPEAAPAVRDDEPAVPASTPAARRERAMRRARETR